MEQAKIFRSYDGMNYRFLLIPYTATDNYSSFIKANREQGLRQVIINSEIMIKILVSVVKDENSVIQQVKLNNYNDEDIQNEIDNIARGVKTNRTNIGELVRVLSWASEDNSIDIETVTIAYMNNEINKFESIDIFCNGILSGHNTLYFYQKYLHKILLGYFNDEHIK